MIMDVTSNRSVDRTPAMDRKRSKSATRQRFSAIFIGSTTLDNHFTSSMMPWVLAELRRNPLKECVTLEIIDGLLITYRAQDGHELFRHSVYQISRFAQTNSDRTSFMYLVNERQVKSNLDLLCFLFKMDNEKSVGDLFMTVKEEKSLATTPATPKLSAVPKQMTRSLSLCGDSPPNLSQFYEVLFLGKIQASHKRAPPTFIDDALKKFKLRESIKAKKRRESADEKERSSPEDEDKIKHSHENFNKIKINVHSEEKENIDIQSAPSSHPLKTQEHKPNEDHPLADGQPIDSRLSSTENQPNFSKHASDPVIQEGVTSSLIEGEGGHAQPRNRSKSIISSNSAVTNASQICLGDITVNRTMLLQIARTDLRLISPDKRQVLLHKSFKEISHCSSGVEFKEHFGFICKEASHDGYVGYIFRCDSSNVVEDIMQGLKSAFQIAHESARKVKATQQCEKCPMVWFNQLCMDLDGLNANKAQNVLLRRVEKLEESEREDLLAKMQGAETPNIEEQNQILMMLLRANCEVKQQSHDHISVLLPQPPPTPSTDHNAHSLSEAAIKAKRSLATTFNGIMRRKTSVVDASESSTVNPAPSIVLEKPTPVKMPHPLSVTNAERRLALEKSVSPEKNPLNPLTPEKHTQFNCEVSSPGGGGRRRAGTLGASGGETMKRELARRSALARRKQEAVQEEKQQEGEISPLSIFMKTSHYLSPLQVHTPTSRHSIFQKVVTPRKSSCAAPEVKKNEPRNYQEIWQKAIKQQILLNRMERENKKMQEMAEIVAEKKLKLEYKSLVPSTADLYSLWENLLSVGPCRSSRLEVGQAVGRGVPRSRRGEVWQLLVNLQEQRSPPPDTDTDKFGQWDQAYSVLKSQLTSHQHSILIDLGRTFPSHAYFSGALGLGQLSLFNLLKAYSILDPEVGYCQGLPFLGGLLLMHLDEEASFSLLKHLMFGLGLRKQFMPDMTGLQVYMYQLTRLLAETQPSLYRQLDRLEVDPSLYATPWFLTLFAAHFPLGFVARVFDLLFLEGPHAIIKVGVCLMVECAESMLECDNLEDVMNVIKTDLPALPPERLEDVIKQANGLNISRQLRTYEVEYHVMQEELSTQAINKAKDMECLTQANNKLRSENAELLDQLKSKNLTISRLEAEVTFACQEQQQAQQQFQICHNNLLKAYTLLDQLKPLCGSNIPDNIRTLLDELLQSENGNLPQK